MNERTCSVSPVGSERHMDITHIQRNCASPSPQFPTGVLKYLDLT